MKKLTLGIMLVIALVFTLVPDALLWCKRTLLNAPTIHKIETGEYLSKISQRYYGTAKYWQELALINRAPNSNLVFPGEDIFIPGKEVVEQLHRARSLSKVNQLMNDEERLYANLNAPKSTAPEVTAAEPELAATGSDTVSAATLMPASTESAEQKTSNGLIFLLGLGIVVVVVGVIAFIVYRKIQASRYAESLDDLPPIKVGPQKKEDSTEPDYEKYRKNRSERVYV